MLTTGTRDAGLICKGKDAPDSGLTMTIKELSARIGFSYYTIYDWINKRGMPVRRPFKGSHMVIVWSEFEDWWKRVSND